MKSKRDKFKIRDRLKNEYQERKRAWFPGYVIPESKLNLDHWDRASEFILEVDGNVHEYIDIVFRRCNPPMNADVFLLSDKNTMELYRTFLASKPSMVKKNIEWMERLYAVKIKKGFSKPRVLMDTTIPFNAPFRYTKALTENLLEVAFQFEQAAIDFFSEYPEYYEYYKDRIPEDIKCQI